MIQLFIPLLLFRRTPGSNLEEMVETLEKKKEQPKKERGVLRCGHCKSVITESKFAVPIAGQHRHTFVNPSGIPYEIGCFSQAPGCFNTGEPTLEFTWFQGYTWCYSICKKCYTHMGWHYQSGDSHFFGLILNRLTYAT